MATTTTNYGWTVPTSSDLVKNGATAISTVGSSVDTALWNTGKGQAGKNKIINGDFSIWQRGTSFSNPANGTYCADRFKTINDGTGATRTISQQAFTPGAAPVAGYESQYFMRYAVSAIGTGNTYQGMNHYIEDVRTFAGQAITVSFWAKADASRNVNVDLSQNFGSGGSGTVYVTLSAASAAVTTSWQRFTFTGTVASISGKTIGTGSALVFGYYAPAATACTIDIWGVQVEAGSTATPFCTASGGSQQAELALCQRYYYRQSASSAYATFGLGTANATTTALISINPPSTMRVSPTAVDYSTLALWDGVSVSSALTNLTLTASPNFCILTATIAAGLVLYRPYFILANNSTSAYVGLTAEL
jgi:hypothetical protein